MKSKHIIFVAVLLFLSSCRATNQNARNALTEDQVEHIETKMCAAVRGNGHYLFSHFGSLAAIIEEAGSLDGMSGGSSASVTTFLYESMLLNPNLNTAFGKDFDGRLALLLKSMMGYMEVLAESEEVQAIQSLTLLGRKIQTVGLQTLTLKDGQEAAHKLLGVLSDDGIRNLVNPKILKLLSSPLADGYKSYEYKIAEIRKAALTIGAFDASDVDIIYREGIISYSAFAVMLSRIANFYAGYGPMDQQKWQNFLGKCAEPTRGLNWVNAASTIVEGTSCRQRFTDLLVSYRTEAKEKNYNFDRDRINDKLGEKLSVVIASSIITGKNARQSYEVARKSYLAGKSEQYKINFDEVKFGYFVSPKDAAALEIYSSDHQEDKKLKRFMNLNGETDVSWKTVLQVSPMEPGLAPIVWSDQRPDLFFNGAQNMGYAGGWSDLAPVQVLRGIGCDEVVYVTRRGIESEFLSKDRKIMDQAPRVGVAEILGMKQKAKDDLFEWSNSKSSFRLAVDQADSIWCTDWNLAGNTDFGFMFNHSYDIGKPDTKYFTSNDTGWVPNSPIALNRFKGRHLKTSTPGCLEQGR